MSTQERPSMTVSEAFELGLVPWGASGQGIMRLPTWLGVVIFGDTKVLTWHGDEVMISAVPYVNGAAYMDCGIIPQPDR